MKKVWAFLIIIVVVSLILVITVAITYPYVYKDSVIKYSKENNLDPMLVMAVIKTESSFDKEASSPKGAKGLMQIGKSTGQWAAEIFEIDDYSDNMLYEADFNIRIGTWYIRQLTNQFGSEKVALAAYNAGSGNVAQWLSNIEYSGDGENLDLIPFSETSNYVKKVERNKKVYKFFYENTLYTTNDALLDNMILNIRKALTKIVRGLK